MITMKNKVGRPPGPTTKAVVYKRMYDSGLTMVDIASRFNVSKQAVSQAINKHWPTTPVKRGRPQVSCPVAEDIFIDVVIDIPDVERLSKFFSTTEDRVERWINEAGIQEVMYG